MSTKDKLTSAKTRMGAFAKACPDLLEGFSKVSKTASRSGTFSTAQKELIATAISVAKGCDDCILYHLDAARRHGAEEADLLEALEIAVEMGGGPAVMYASKALEAYRTL